MDPRQEPQDENLEETADVGGGDSLAPRRIGHFHLKRMLATGGMGTVYEAVQESPRRVVALKIMRPGVVSKTALRRFEYESQILARLHHPNVAQVFESGQHTEHGVTVPYFAMEYIPSAKAITEYAHRNRLDTFQRLELFVRVCDAVHHGHQKGIIHRDLKPSNILVDANGDPKVIDFGVARATDSDMAITTEQTAVGEMVGTLKYMSPEQCEADPHNLDTRSDIYALGVVLFELLTEHLPYSLENTPVFDVPRIIREDPPTRLAHWDRSLRGDIETIVAKALEKKREMRYQSAADLAGDIRRFRNSEPILARPASLAYRLQKFAWRRRVRLAVTATIALLGAFGIERQMHARRAAGAQYYVEALAGALQPDPADAIANCTAAIERNPELAPAYALRAKLNWDRKEVVLAEADCVRALARDPWNTVALRTIASIRLSRGDFASALQAFEKGMEASVATHGLPGEYHNRARLLRNAGRLDEALRDHDRAVALNFSNQADPFIGRAFTRRFAGDVEGALSDLSRAAEMESGNWFLQAQQWKWEILMMRGDPGDRERADDAIRLARARATTPLEQAFVGVTAGNVEGSRALEFAKSSATLRAIAHYYIGSKALVAGDREQAIDSFQRCRSADAHDQYEFDLATWHLKQLTRPDAAIAGRESIPRPRDGTRQLKRTEHRSLGGENE